MRAARRIPPPRLRLGQRQVHSGESLVGTSSIVSILKGCAIMEHWRGGGGTEGKSLFFYDRVTDTWKQVWVTENATAPGGLKEKTLLPVERTSRVQARRLPVSLRRDRRPCVHSA